MLLSICAALYTAILPIISVLEGKLWRILLLPITCTLAVTYVPWAYGAVEHAIEKCFGIEPPEKRPVEVLLRTEIRQYKLISYRPPKHFYVTLEYNGVKKEYHVSKHCNSYKDNKLGDVYNIPTGVFKMSNSTKEYTRPLELRKVFC